MSAHFTLENPSTLCVKRDSLSVAEPTDCSDVNGRGHLKSFRLREYYGGDLIQKTPLSLPVFANKDP